MSDLSANIKAINQKVELLNIQTKRGRNDRVRDYHKRLPKSVQESIVFRHGSAQYRDKTLEKFFQLINKRPVHLPIHFAGGDDNELLAKAAGDMFDMAFNKALGIRDTGRHLNSIRTFIREVGGPAQIEITSGRITESMLPDRAIVSVVAVVDYANTLEYWSQSGILYHAAQMLRRRYGKMLAVKYDYVGGKWIGERGGTFPRIQIGHYGNLRPGFKRPGRSARKKQRSFDAQRASRQ